MLWFIYQSLPCHDWLMSLRVALVSSRASLMELVRGLVMEWSQHGIHVDTISPEYILTSMKTNPFQEFPERQTMAKGEYSGEIQQIGRA